MSIPKILLEKGYQFLKEFNPGGQSNTCLISKDSNLYLVKRPISKELSTEQKFRFQQEAEALKMLDGAGAPEVYDYAFDDEPFILMQYIEGKPLTEIVSGKALELEYAISIIFQILKILSKVHEIGLLHRDIKPDNIVIHKNGDVYLIDFGLCRIDAPERGYKTPASKELGNRFLRLPEFGKGEKVSSSVSDITFVTGLLFYMLSGKAPHMLLDEHGNYPQQRGLLPKAIFDLAWVMYTFDKGFSYQIAQRFQSAEELINFISDHKDRPNNMSEDNPAEQFSMLLNTNEFRRRDNILKLVNDAHRAFIGGVNDILNEHLVTGGTGPNPGENHNTVVTAFFVHRTGYSQPLSPYRLVSVIDENLNAINYSCDFENPDQGTGSFSPSETSRVIDEYRTLGQLRGKEAVRKLIELVKSY